MVVLFLSKSAEAKLHLISLVRHDLFNRHRHAAAGNSVMQRIFALAGIVFAIAALYRTGLLKKKLQSRKIPDQIFSSDS